MFAHTPYDGSTRPFTIGMSPLDLRDWIEPDGNLARDLAEKDSLLAGRRAVVFRHTPGSDAAQRETLELLAAFLPARFPHLYTAREGAIEVAGRPVHLDEDAPLLVASRLVQEDLCLMVNGDSGWRLAAASLCFPSTWSLEEKIDRDMNDIHVNVPGFPGRMHDMVRRIFDNLKVEFPVRRLNWSIYGDGALHHPESKSDPLERFPEHLPALARAHIRVERQTLRKLPQTQAILFTIRVHSDPIAQLAGRPDGRALARALRGQLLELDEAQLDYKGLTQARARLAAALDALAM